MRLRLIIFDFDGVLVNSFSVYYAFNKAAMAAIGKDLSEDEYRNLFTANVHQGFRSLTPDDILYEKFLQFKKENFERYYNSIEFFPEAADFIRNLQPLYDLAIASSTGEHYIKKMLAQEEAENCFKLILGGGDYTKENMVRKILESLNFQPHNATLVSDTSGDVALAQKLGLATIAVTWGYHPIHALKAISPTFIAANFQELEKFLTLQNNWATF